MDAQLAGLRHPVQGLSAAGPASAPALKGLPFNQGPCEPVVWPWLSPGSMFYTLHRVLSTSEPIVRGREGACLCVSAGETHVCVVLLNSIIRLLLKPYKTLQTSCVITLNLQNSKPLGKKGLGTQSPPLKIGEGPGTEEKGAGRRQDVSTLFSKFRGLASWCGVDRSGGHQNPDLD